MARTKQTKKAEKPRTISILPGDPNFLFVNEAGTYATVWSINDFIESGTPIVPDGYGDEGDDMQYVGYVGLGESQLPRGAVDLAEYQIPNENESVDYWADDLTQFARVLAEIKAVGGLPAELAAKLVDATDLSVDQLAELFVRAEKVFELVKAELTSG